MLIKILVKSVCNISRSLGNNEVGQRKLLVFGIFYSFWTSRRLLSSSTALVYILYPLFLGSVIYDNKFETKEIKFEPRIKYPKNIGIRPCVSTFPLLNIFCSNKLLFLYLTKRNQKCQNKKKAEKC